MPLPRLAAFALCALLTGPAALRAAEPVTLRVMSYNIHHGEGLDGRLDLERIARVVLEAKADIVGLQEVDRGVARTQQRDLPAELAKLTGMHVAFERNIVHQGGDYGNATLSRFPIKRTRNLHYRMLRPGEQRGLLQVVLDVNGREILFLNTHLDYRPDDAERRANVEELHRVVTEAGRTPVLLVGDFNAVPTSAPIRSIAEFLTDTWSVVGKGDGFTIPVRKPAKRIDYIWFTPGAFEPTTIAVLPTEASDHLPVIAELRLK
jgi:endonuclease/exonuclease/phosphatase family metal-dependent hydrolase